MKENVLDVLMYLFENYFYDEPAEDTDRETMQAALLEAGFSDTEVDKAFDWLDGLAEQREVPELGNAVTEPVRIFSDFEQQRLDAESRGFLMVLQNAGVLDANRREMVIDRVMALDSQLVDLDDLKWIILMVLFTQKGQEANFAWMENHLFSGTEELRH